MKKSCFSQAFLVAFFLLIFLALPGCVPAENDPAEVEAEAEEELEEQLGVAFATNHEFMVREDGLEALQETYDFAFDRVYDMPTGVTHDALREGYVDAALGFATDGRIEALDLVSLEDDRGFFPVYNPAPVVREKVLEKYPQLTESMAEIAGHLDTETMIRLNYLVDIEGYTPEEVAFKWLLDEGLIAGETAEAAGGEPVVVSSKTFTEQLVLGQITLLALEHAGIPVEDSTGLGGESATKVNRNALLMGNSDLYWEYTGTAWMIIHEEKMVISDPEKVYSLVKERDREKGLIWLDYAPFNNTYTIMMRKEHAEELGIETFSELAQWVRQTSP